MKMKLNEGDKVIVDGEELTVRYQKEDGSFLVEENDEVYKLDEHDVRKRKLLFG